MLMYSTIFISSNIEEVNGKNKIVNGASCDTVHRMVHLVTQYTELTKAFFAFKLCACFVYFSSNLDTIRYRRTPPDVIKHL